MSYIKIVQETFTFRKVRIGLSRKTTGLPRELGWHTIFAAESQANWSHLPMDRKSTHACQKGYLISKMFITAEHAGIFR